MGIEMLEPRPLCAWKPDTSVDIKSVILHIPVNTSERNQSYLVLLIFSTANLIIYFHMFGCFLEHVFMFLYVSFCEQKCANLMGHTSVLTLLSLCTTNHANIFDIFLIILKFLTF